jgi:hypothetical protein
MLSPIWISPFPFFSPLFEQIQFWYGMVGYLEPNEILRNATNIYTNSRLGENINCIFTQIPGQYRGN